MKQRLNFLRSAVSPSVRHHYLRQAAPLLENAVVRPASNSLNSFKPSEKQPGKRPRYEQRNDFSSAWISLTQPASCARLFSLLFLITQKKAFSNARLDSKGETDEVVSFFSILLSRIPPASRGKSNQNFTSPNVRTKRLGYCYRNWNPRSAFRSLATINRIRKCSWSDGVNLNDFKIQPSHLRLTFEARNRGKRRKSELAVESWVRREEKKGERERQREPPISKASS